MANVFTQTPLDNALARQRATRQARSVTQPGLAPRQATMDLETVTPASVSAPAPETGSPFDRAALRYNVPVNVIEALGETAGIAPEHAEDFASRAGEMLAAPLSQGMSMREAVASLWPNGAPDGAAEAILARAVAIADTKYPAPAAPAAEAPAPAPRGIVRSVIDPFGTTEEALKGLARGVTGSAGALATAVGADETGATLGKVAENPALDPAVASYKDVSGPASAGQYLASLLAESAPEMAAVTAAGVGGALAAGPVGGITAALGTSTLFNAGRNIERQAAENDGAVPSALRAYGVGLAQGGLDIIVPGHAGGFVTRMLGAAERGWAKVGKEVAEDTGLEAATETAQQLMEIGQANPDLLRVLVAPRPDEVEKSDQLVAELVESAIGGGAAGGAMAAGAAAFRRSPAAEAPAPEPEAEAPLMLPAPALITPPPSGPLGRAIAAGPAPLAPDMQAGDTIEIQTSDGEVLTGTYVGEDASGTGGVRVNVDGQDAVIPREEIEAGEVVLARPGQAPAAAPQVTQDAPPAPIEPAPAAETGALGQAAMDAVSPMEPAPAPPVSDPRERLAFINEMGRANGWNGRLVQMRTDLEAQIAAEAPAAPVIEPSAAPAAEVAPATALSTVAEKGGAADAGLAAPLAAPVAAATPPIEEEHPLGNPDTDPEPLPPVDPGIDRSAPDPIKTLTLRKVSEKGGIVDGLTPEQAEKIAADLKISLSPNAKGGFRFSWKHEARLREAVDGFAKTQNPAPETPITEVATPLAEKPALTPNAESADITEEAKARATEDEKPEPAKPASPRAKREAKAPAAIVTHLKDDFGNWSVPTGAILKSTTGRALAPAPKWDSSNNRLTKLSLTRQREWLVAEAKAEAEARGERHMLREFSGFNPKNWTMSDADAVNDYLFGTAYGPAGDPASTPAETAAMDAAIDEMLAAPAQKPAFDPVKASKPFETPEAIAAKTGIPAAVKYPRGFFQTFGARLGAVEADRAGVKRGWFKAVITRQSPYSSIDGVGETLREAQEDAALRAERSVAKENAARPAGVAIVMDPAKGTVTVNPIAATPKPAASIPDAKRDTPAYGASNTLVSKDRAAELREKLKAKLRDQINSGIDPEILAIGAELAVFHIEAGARRFADMAKAIADDLGTTPKALRKYLRAWYNGARDMLEDSDVSIDGMDDPDAVRAAVKALEVENASVGGGQPGAADEAGEPAADRDGSVGTGQPDGDEGAGGVEAPAAGAVSGDAGAERAAGDGARPRRKAAGGGARSSGGGAASVGREDAGLRGHDDDGAGRSGPEVAGRSNYRITDPEAMFGGGPKGRFAKNRAAIEAVEAISSEDREPTQAELDAMASYIGWGSFGQELFQGSWERRVDREGWKAEQTWLRDTLGEDAWKAAQNSITNAHYTDPPTVQAMWSAMEAMGFKGGRVLEPAMGVGNFFGLMPPGLASNSTLTGIELDTTTGRMAQALYPQAAVKIMGYEASKTPDGFYDMVIGNWPFANFEVPDRRYLKLKPSLHNYFFLKAVDQVRPGGIVMGISSAFTMDAKTRGIRNALARKAELVASFRLPTGAFEGYAGTSVVTDIVILRKRAEPILDVSKEGWIDVTDIDTGEGVVTVNEYYKAHPDHVLGRLGYGSGSTYGRPSMLVHREPDFAAKLAALPKLLPADAYQPVTRGKEERFISNNTGARQLSIVEKDGGLWRVMGERLEPLDAVVKYRLKDEAKTAAREAEIRDLIGIAGKAGAVLDADRAGDADAETKRKALKRTYDAFRKAHGPIADSYAIGVLRKAEDPNAGLLLALEGFDGKPAAIMTKATTRAARDVENPTVRDAFVIARNESVSLDLDRIAELAKRPVDDVTADLLDSGAIFRTPGGGHEAADVYLAGNVRVKLRDARDAQAAGEDMEKSIAALVAVQPPDQPFYQIEARFGADWIPAEDMATFIAEKLGDASQAASVKVVRGITGWSVKELGNLDGRPESGQLTKGDTRLTMFIQAALNTTTLDVKYPDADGNMVKDVKATEELNQRIGEFRNGFGAWAWGEPERRVRLERTYNEIMNAIADVTYDGSFLDFPGMALARGDQPFNLRSHQSNAIWRGVLNQRGIFGHEVGTGKTVTMAAIAVESRRFGLARKPLIVAHNANSAAVAAEAQETYPGGRFLYVDNLAPAEIATTLHRIATEDWDAIVIPHSVLERVSLREDTLMAMAAEDILAYEREAIEAAREEGIDLTVAMMNADDKDLYEKTLNSRQGVGARTAKEMVKTRNRIIAKIKEQALKAAKDGAISFEELGIDMILVDEAHEFKKPPITTRMSVRGLNKGTSNRSLQLRFLTNYVKSLRGGKGVFTFTGTPITNTLAEIYHQLYYVMDDVMRQNHVDTWDGFFKTFADSIADVEVTSAGDYESVERLASFVNVAELRRMAGQYLDIVFADDMPEFKPRATASGKTAAAPDLTDAEREYLRHGYSETPTGRPYKKTINDIGPMGPEQRDILEEVVGHARAFRAANGKDRIAIMREGGPDAPIVFNEVPNRASMDARLHDISAPDHPESKANRAVANLARIYKENDRATQILFVDQGYSSFSTKVAKDKDGNATGKVKVPKFNMVEDIVAKLVAQGVNREEIAIVAGGVTAQKKREIADKMNRREVRIAIGQTATLGVGVNAQKWLKAMHHLDAPWMPGDLEQRNGRGQRQGNHWNTVEEYRYLTEGLDPRRWQVLAIKDRFIKSFLKADQSVRVIEGDAADDADSMDAMGLADTLAQASGDPRVAIRTKLKVKLDRLARRERIFVEGLADASRRARWARDSNKTALANIGKLEADVATVAAARDTPFKATIAGKEYENRAEAEVALKGVIDALYVPRGEGRPVPIEVSGFTVAVASDYAGRPDFTLQGKGDYRMGAGTLASMEAVMRRLAKRLEDERAEIADREVSIRNLDAAQQATFPQAKDLKAAEDKLKAVERDMQDNPVPPPSWLRQGAPVDTLIYVAGAQRVVTGHRWTADGWFVATDEGLVPYLDAKDQLGSAIFDERPFEAPKIEEGSKLTTGDEPDEAEAGTMASVGLSRTAFADRNALRAHIFGLPGIGRFAQQLSDAGFLRFYETPGEAQHPLTAGLTHLITRDMDPNLSRRSVASIHLYADNMNSDTASGVLLHELFHAGAERLIGAPAWDKLMARVDTLREVAIRRDPNLAGRAPYASAEEFAAYTLEYAERDQRPGLRDVLDRLLGAFKAFLLRRFGTQAGAVTPEQLRAIAIAALRSEAKRRGGSAPVAGRTGAMASIAQAGGMSEAAVDAGERSLIGHAITKAMSGSYNLLALVPGRALFTEMAGSVPAAHNYLRVKEEMDALRSQWHQRADTVAQDWRKLGLKGEGNTEMMALMHDATLAGVDPALPFKMTGDATEDAKRHRAYADLRPRYKALPEAHRAIYERVRDEYRDLNAEFEKTLLGNVSKAMDAGLRDAQRAFDAENQRIADEGLRGEAWDNAKRENDRRRAAAERRHGWGKRAKFADLRAKLETQKVPEPYFPLARFGQFAVTARDAAGKVVHFSRHEYPGVTPKLAALRKAGLQAQITQAEMVADLEAQGLKVQTGTIGETSVKEMVDPTFVADVEGIIDAQLGKDGAGVMDAIWQRWLESLPDLSVRKNRIHRKGTPGFNSDAFRAFGFQMFHGSHQLARLRYAIDLEESLKFADIEAQKAADPVRTGLVVEEMRKRHAFTMNPASAPWAQAISSAAFVYYLAATPAAAIVNLSQTTIMGSAILGAYAGSIPKATAALARAMRDFVGGRGETWRDQVSVMNSPRLTDEERAAMREAYRRGTVDASQAHDLAGVTETGIEYNDLRTKWMGRISFFFHHAERLNREVTFLAAYRLAREKGLDQTGSIEAAAGLTWKSHFDYQNTSRPRFMQNDIGKVALIFRNFGVQMLWRLIRDSHQALKGASPEERREARTQLAGITGMMALHAGVRGVWGYALIMSLLGLLFPGGSDDAEDELQRAVVGTLGPQLGGILLDGLPGYALGVDLTSRMGMPELWFRAPDRNLEGQDEYFYWVSQMLGAGVGMAETMWRGVSTIREGDVVRGLETMAPKVVRDQMRAYRYAVEGATTRNGDPITEAALADAIKQSLGFVPAELAERYSANSRMKNMETRISDERSQIMSDVAAAVMKGGTVPQSVIDAVNAFNAANPDWPIKTDNLRTSMQSRARSAAAMDGGIMLNPKIAPRVRSLAAPPVYGE